MKLRLQRAARRRNNLPRVTEIQRLRLRPGEALVVHVPAGMQADAIARMTRLLQRVLGRPDLPIIVAPPGLRFGVVDAQAS